MFVNESAQMIFHVCSILFAGYCSGFVGFYFGFRVGSFDDVLGIFLCYCFCFAQASRLNATHRFLLYGSRC